MTPDSLACRALALEFVVPMRESEFGFVLVDQQTGTTLMHCGCYGMWYLRGN